MCSGVSTGIFFDNDPTEALKICRACPVSIECLRVNLDVPEGVFGATTATTRAAIRDRHGIPALDATDQPESSIPNHGTHAGAARHRRYGLPMCEECRAADVAYKNIHRGPHKKRQRKRAAA